MDFDVVDDFLKFYSFEVKGVSEASPVFSDSV